MLSNKKILYCDIMIWPDSLKRDGDITRLSPYSSHLIKLSCIGDGEPSCWDTIVENDIVLAGHIDPQPSIFTP